MKNTIKKKIKCKDTLWLLYIIIDSIEGMPIGNYLSQYFGNLYLSSLDHIMKEELKAKYYFRYCDDIVILHHSKHYLRFCLFVIKINIKKLKLKRNYQIFKTYKRGLYFLKGIFYLEKV